jgi:hypothetical protein
MSSYFVSISLLLILSLGCAHSSIEAGPVAVEKCEGRAPSGLIDCMRALKKRLGLKTAPTFIPGPANETDAERLERFRRVPQIPDVWPTDFQYRALYVGQGRSRVDSRSMYTGGLGPCVGLAILNYTNKTGMISHIDALTNVDLIFEAYLRDLGSGDLSAVVTDQHVFADPPHGIDDLLKVIRMLDKYKIPIQYRKATQSTEQLGINPKHLEFY